MSSLLSFLESGLKRSDSGLGDRSKYVGSSDIGHCLEKSFLSKTIGEEHDLKQLLIFERGHIAEGIVRNGLLNHEAKPKFYEQVETKGFNKETAFIKTHIDFVVEFPNEIIVVECKSISSPLPDNQPRESWIYQVQLQLGLLRHTAKKQCNRGKIVAFNVNSGEAHEFDVKFNEELFKVAIKRANIIWNAVKTNTAPKGEVSELCGYCSFKTQCQTLKKGAIEMPKEIEIIAKRVKEYAQMEKKIKADKENLKAFMEAANTRKAVGDNVVLSYIERKGAEKISKVELLEKYPEVANNVTYTADAYSYVKIF
jgi:CRISPR-associated exonuclease Cas4